MLLHGEGPVLYICSLSHCIASRAGVWLCSVCVDKGNRKLRYAEKMAAAHRKAAGLGEFAPEKNTSYVKIRGGQGDASSKWSRQDSNTVDDEFDF